MASSKKTRSEGDDKAAGLPFVKNGRPRDWWAATPTGNWSEDCAAGAFWARDYLIAERTAPDNASLGWIMLAMIRKGDQSGLVVGFALELLRCAKLGLDRISAAPSPSRTRLGCRSPEEIVDEHEAAAERRRRAGGDRREHGAGQRLPEEFMKMNETAVEGQPGAMQPLKVQPLAGRGRAWCRVMMHARRQRRRCFWCRRPLAPGPGLPSSPTLDHLIPRSRGGLGLRANLVAACARCNGTRRAMPASKFLGLLLRKGAG